MRNREKANLTDFEKWELHDKFVLSVYICAYMHMYVFKLSRKLSAISVTAPQSLLG